ncbi:MAG TPA: hypothetical protein VGD52_13870 [Pseudoduganella sp.]
MKLGKTKAVILCALLADCMFGRMAFLASTGAFENPDPSRFEQFKTLWMVLSWLIPALLIALFVEHRLIAVAATVKFVASSLLMALAYPSFVPIGDYLPHPPGLILAMAEELVTVTLLAVLVTWLIHFSHHKIVARFGRG